MSKREKRAKPSVKAEEVVELPIEIPRELFERLMRDIEKGSLKIITPYSLAKEYNVKISLARKLLRLAYKTGKLKLYSGGRRTPIYIAG